MFLPSLNSSTRYIYSKSRKTRLGLIEPLMPRGNHDDHNERNGKNKKKTGAKQFAHKRKRTKKHIFYDSLLRWNAAAASTEQQAAGFFIYFFFDEPLPRDE